MQKKNLCFNIYLKNELENDIEIVGQFETIKDLETFFQKSKSTLFDLGIKKVKGLHIEIEDKGKKYVAIVDSL